MTSRKADGKWTVPMFRSEMLVPIDEFSQYMTFYNNCEK